MGFFNSDKNGRSGESSGSSRLAELQAQARQPKTPAAARADTPPTKSSRSASASRGSDGPGIQRNRHGRLAIDRNEGRTAATKQSVAVSSYVNTVIENANKQRDNAAVLRAQNAAVTALKRAVSKAKTPEDKKRAKEVRDDGIRVQKATDQYAKDPSRRNHKKLEAVEKKSGKTRAARGK